MHDLEDSIKQKHWKDLKAAVGTAAQQAKSGGNKMTVDELLLNVRGVQFSSMVCQTDIQTEEDKAFYNRQGYSIPVTEQELTEKLKLDPACIWYTPSVSDRSLYFNPETLAAAPLHLEMLLEGMYPGSIDNFYKALQGRENDVAAGKYYGSISSLPDAMQMEYFNRLVVKKGPEIPDLYELFFVCYINSDYGFRGIAPETLNAILASKTEKDKAKTMEALEQLPDTLTIYRGGNSASVPYSEAYSWTLDINVANFFACRRGTGEGWIVEAEVAKQDVIDAFLDTRDEKEVFVDPSNVNVRSVTPVFGLDYVKELLPEVRSMYQEYQDKLPELEFAQDSVDHGMVHEARVMLLSLIMAYELDLPLRDWRVLSTAAIYHDTQRVHDDDDIEHGAASREYYHNSVKDPDPLVEFLIEYHSRPDEEGYAEIQNNRKLSKSRTRSKLLFEIFKDADALERVRFGVRALDMKYLRLPISKNLTLAAKMLTESIKTIESQKRSRPTLSSQIQNASVRNAHPASSNQVPVKRPEPDR